ncbi:MAG: DUF2892 domain-containing protein [Dokdonella sp.]
MKINVGIVDRVVRIIVGLILVSLPFVLDSPWRWFGLLGVMPLITGFSARCPAYGLLGVNSCRLQKPD